MFLTLGFVFLLLLEKCLSPSSSPAAKLLQQLPRVCQCLGSPPRMERRCQFLPAAFVAHGSQGTWLACWLSLSSGFAHEVDAVYVMQTQMRMGRGQQETIFPLMNFPQGNHCFCCIAQEYIVF